MGQTPQAKDYYRVANGFLRNSLQDAKITGFEFVNFIQDLWHKKNSLGFTNIFSCTCEDTYQAAISGAKQFLKEREEAGFGFVFEKKRVEIRSAHYNRYKDYFKTAYERMEQSGLIELVIY